jgi:ribose transport system permease protein
MNLRTKPAAAGPDPGANPEVAPIQLRAGRKALDFAFRFATVGVLIALLIVTTILYDGFWEIDNLRNILSQNAPIGLVAIGMTYVIISGNFDLSVGSIVAAGAVFYASVGDEWSPLVGALATLLVGAGFGVINGFIVTKWRVNSLIATIGTGAIISGLTYLYCDSSAVEVIDPSFSKLGLEKVAGIPLAGLILAAVFIVAGIVLQRSVYGRSLFAVGGNVEAARLAGIRVDAIKISAFVLVGVCSAFAGAILASQLSIGDPSMGATAALDAFAIVVIGGTSVAGGEGAIWRTAVGLTILAVMTNLFNSLTLIEANQSIAKGAILVAALGLDALARSRRGG